MAPADPRDRRRCGPEHRAVAGAERRRVRAQPLRRAASRRARRARSSVPSSRSEHQPRERRIAEDATALELARHEARRSRGAWRRPGSDAPGRSVCTSTRPGRVAAAGAAGDLHEQLERALAGAEVGDVERQVREQHDHQRDARDVVSLAHHLRADEDVGLARRASRAGCGAARRGAGRRRDRCGRRRRRGSSPAACARSARCRRRTPRSGGPPQPSQRGRRRAMVSGSGGRRARRRGGAR